MGLHLGFKVGFTISKFGDIAVHVPFDIVDLMVSEQVIQDLLNISHYFFIGEIKHQLIP